jgi:acetyl esterase
MAYHTSILDEETETFLKGFSKLFESISSLSIPEQRSTIKGMFSLPEDELEPVAQVKDKVIHGRHGSINLRLFIPKNDKTLPVIVYFHRGGWVYGSIVESEMICRRLANETGAIVAAVEYRLAPEHKFPIPLEDCYDATKWIADHASTFSGNPQKIILCGESAGGNLAAAVALKIRNLNQFKIAGQLLIYPILTSKLEPKHYDESPDKSLLSHENMEFFWSAYLSSREDGHNPYASPLHCKDFAGLPPSLIITAEHDALKHDGETYGKALHKAGVSQQTRCYEGVIHGFLDLPLAEDKKQEALQDITAWVKSI